MKAHVADYQTRTLCLRIEASGGLVVRLTRHVRDLVMSNGDVYLSASGYEFTGYSTSTDLSPSVVDLQGIVGLAGVERDAIASGVFNGAQCYLFATSWASPVVDEEPMTKSILGKATLRDDVYVIEEMGLIDTLNQTVGLIVTASCQKTFGSAQCGKALGPLTVTGTLSAVVDQYTLQDATRIEPADYFGAGTIAFTTGPNVGLRPLQITDYAADGTITLQDPPYYAVTAGTGYTMIPGCRKRETEDCKTKWANRVNFGAFSNVPTSSVYTQTGGQG